MDLRTGGMRPHDRADRMTKVTTATLTPGAQCPTWMQFLDQATGSDPQLLGYLQRVFGYCLTGSTQEHALFFLYGTGANGKSVFVNTLFTIAGDYAANAPMDTFMETRGDRHPTDLAGLRGAPLRGRHRDRAGPALERVDDQGDHRWRRVSRYLSPESCSQRQSIGGAQMRLDDGVTLRVERYGVDV